MRSQVSTFGKIDEGLREHMICNREAYRCIHSMRRYSVDPTPWWMINCALLLLVRPLIGRFVILPTLSCSCIKHQLS
ncbi:uncharacterized protein BO88DRAFT_53777 [Aspergillus vadensis CBS 113365]|uniref:Uncharacterized protein n=1 Tax=Aspergillus vadensis (strain CBS 113365 / IMI 142717 / IBT 24658) TaxID=1448311 RepID=A0A319BAN4_ASPVC|nr:hypothetical protein BO88DRAFT_53777 [Aspergillus vadensis CBS 113365]PYH68914.1 hypothetical protein BO88DRAFT_53777 [Aspergillus vadensis CBS 113365]